MRKTLRRHRGDPHGARRRWGIENQDHPPSRETITQESGLRENRTSRLSERTEEGRQPDLLRLYFSSPPARGARRFVSGPLFCATSPDGLVSCTGTPILRFSVMLIGYMRVSSSDERQVVDLQLDALLAAGVDERHLHQDKQSGGRDDRAGLKTCLAGLRAGDVLVVWKLDRLGRSLSHLVRILD